jgi:putative hydrolase of the HAD superfamily
VKVEAFIFDIGNVLLRFRPGQAEEALARLGLSSLPDLAVLQDLGLRYERGALDRAGFLSALRDILGHTGPDEDLTRAWQEIFQPNEPMWRLVEALHGHYPLYLLSNTNCLHHEYVAREYEIFEKFADGVFSYRAKLMKPEPEIFALAIRQFGVEPASTVYLDDLSANVEAARAAGLRAFQYRQDAHADCLATLRAQGVQCV